MWAPYLVAVLFAASQQVPCLAARFATASRQEHLGNRSAESCPDGFICIPAPCDIENSNKEPGHACKCLDGFKGTVTWSGRIPSGKCEPAPCGVPHSNGEPGLQCACAAGYTGSITWSGDAPAGACAPAPCGVPHSNGKSGPECACAPGYAGEVTWAGATPAGPCAPAPCEVPNSNREFGPMCACAPGYAGKVTWSGSSPSGPCTPAPCSVPNSNGRSGPECACDKYSAGTVRFEGAIPKGSCEDIVVNAAALFNESGFMIHGKTEFKCCVYSRGGKGPIIQDMTNETLPSARSVGSPRGCGRMFGDSWHSSWNSDNKCLVKLGMLVTATHLPRKELIATLEYNQKNRLTVNFLENMGVS